jgi:hypothetical protein
MSSRGSRFRGRFRCRSKLGNGSESRMKGPSYSSVPGWASENHGFKDLSNFTVMEMTCS